MLEHGGRLRAAVQRYALEDMDWLDLSTGINPNGWPVPNLPGEVWQRLPQEDDELDIAAQNYYGTQSLLAVAGSQAAIQSLPMLRPPTRVAMVTPSYAEHAQAWQRQGHHVMSVSPTEVFRVGEKVEVAVIVNPNNPTGNLFSRNKLLGLHAQLAARGGWLVVDEAFMDATPEHSLASLCPRPGLIVLRSLGKFFGLAGARVGFVLAERSILHPLAELLGPWPISTPSRYVATRALRDTIWQEATRIALPLHAKRLADLLHASYLTSDGGCTLFNWVCCSDAARVHEQLAQQGILTRLFDTPQSVRFGLPRDEAQWERLTEGLSRMKR